jgi:hypothetical protein
MAAPKSLHVNVKQTDIDIADAHRKDSNQCMIVAAIERSLPEASYVNVDARRIAFTLDRVRYAFMTPPVAYTALMDFDAGRPVAPFSFRCNEPIVLRKRDYVRHQKGHPSRSHKKTGNGVMLRRRYMGLRMPVTAKAKKEE